MNGYPPHGKMSMVDRTTGSALPQQTSGSVVDTDDGNRQIDLCVQYAGRSNYRAAEHGASKSASGVTNLADKATPEEISFIPIWATRSADRRPIKLNNRYRRLCKARFVIGRSANLGSTQDPLVVLDTE